ncbi:hypothetical protein JZ751_010436, partial [Albula glossodonta]
MEDYTLIKKGENKRDTYPGENALQIPESYPPPLPLTWVPLPFPPLFCRTIRFGEKKKKNSNVLNTRERNKTLLSQHLTT